MWLGCRTCAFHACACCSPVFIHHCRLAASSRVDPSQCAAAQLLDSNLRRLPAVSGAQGAAPRHGTAGSRWVAGSAWAGLLLGSDMSREGVWASIGLDPQGQRSACRAGSTRGLGRRSRRMSPLACQLGMACTTEWTPAKHLSTTDHPSLAVRAIAALKLRPGGVRGPPPAPLASRTLALSLKPCDAIDCETASAGQEHGGSTAGAALGAPAGRLPAAAAARAVSSDCRTDGVRGADG